MASCLNMTLLLACCLILVVICMEGVGSQHAPCYACVLYEYRRSQGRSQPYITPPPRNKQPQTTVKNTDICAERSCKCPKEPPVCAEGVLPVKDGCDCCTICPGQLNNICDSKQICDIDKQLRCHNGSCVGISAEYHCFTDGKWYENGHRYNFGCDRECICSGGYFTCSPVCVQERSPPNNCLNARLISVEGKCCKEWKCDNYYPKKPRTASSEDDSNNCLSQEATVWSECSTSCGWGVAKRFKTGHCQPEVSACQIRPCEEDDNKPISNASDGEGNSASLQRVIIDDCASEKMYRMQACPRTNREGQCCQPSLTISRRVKLECPGNKKIKKSILFIQECQCGEQC